MWDTQLLLAINVRLHHPLVMAWMGAVTWLGDHRVTAVVILLLLWWGRRRRDVVAAAAAALATFPLVAVAKAMVQRPRPAEVMSGLFVEPTGLGASFPSGHAVGAFALASVLHVAWPRGRIVWWTLAGAVAWSRVYLGVHYPSDCLAGALLGSGMVFGVVWIVHRAQQEEC